MKPNLQQIREVSDQLLAVSDQVKILRNVAWDEQVQHDFFKHDAQRLPTMKQLLELGVIEGPKFVPPWIKDKRFLLSFLSYSSFFTQFDAGLSSPFYERIFHHY